MGAGRTSVVMPTCRHAKGVGTRLLPGWGERKFGRGMEGVCTFYRTSCTTTTKRTNEIVYGCTYGLGRMESVGHLSKTPSIGLDMLMYLAFGPALSCSNAQIVKANVHPSATRGRVPAIFSNVTSEAVALL